MNTELICGSDFAALLTAYLLTCEAVVFCFFFVFFVFKLLGSVLHSYEAFTHFKRKGEGAANLG